MAVKREVNSDCSENKYSNSGGCSWIFIFGYADR